MPSLAQALTVARDPASSGGRAYRMLVAFVLAACAGGERESRMCQWPPESCRQLDLTRSADRTHLRRDAESAETMVIHYADVSPARRQGMNEYRQVRDECMASLFGAVARNHRFGYRRCPSIHGGAQPMVRRHGARLVRRGVRACRICLGRSSRSTVWGRRFACGGSRCDRPLSRRRPGRGDDFRHVDWHYRESTAWKLASELSRGPPAVAPPRRVVLPRCCRPVLVDCAPALSAPASVASACRLTSALKLTGGYRSKGSGALCPWRAPTST